MIAYAQAGDLAVIALILCVIVPALIAAMIGSHVGGRRCDDIDGRHGAEQARRVERLIAAERSARKS